jgi:hypothetical protein
MLFPEMIPGYELRPIARISLHAGRFPHTHHASLIPGAGNMKWKGRICRDESRCWREMPMAHPNSSLFKLRGHRSAVLIGALQEREIEKIGDGPREITACLRIGLRIGMQCRGKERNHEETGDGSKKKSPENSGDPVSLHYSKCNAEWSLEI